MVAEDQFIVQLHCSLQHTLERRRYCAANLGSLAYVCGVGLRALVPCRVT